MEGETGEPRTIEEASEKEHRFEGARFRSLEYRYGGISTIRGDVDVEAVVWEVGEFE